MLVQEQSDRNRKERLDVEKSGDQEVAGQHHSCLHSAVGASCRVPGAHCPLQNCCDSELRNPGVRTSS